MLEPFEGHKKKSLFLSVNFLNNFKYFFLWFWKNPFPRFASQSSSTSAALPTRVPVFPSNETTSRCGNLACGWFLVPENVCIIKMIQFSSRTRRKKEKEKLLYATCDWTCLNHDCWRPNISLLALDLSQSFVISLLLLIFPRRLLFSCLCRLAPRVR